MKIAVCFAGFLRSFPFTVRNWNYHLKNVDVNFFIHSPNLYNSPSYENTYDARPEEIVQEKFVRECFGEKLKSLKLYQYNPEIFKTIVSDLKIPEKNFIGQQSYRIFSLMFNMQEAIRLVKNTSEKYDLILLSRADTILYSDFDFSLVNQKKISYPKFHGLSVQGNLKDGVAAVYGTPYAFNDQMFLGGYDEMMKFSTIFDMVGEYFINGTIINSETLLGTHCLKNNLSFGTCDFVKYDLLRFAQQ